MNTSEKNEYRESYLILWKGVTDAINLLENHNSNAAIQTLIKAQQDAEEAYISAEDK